MSGFGRTCQKSRRSGARRESCGLSELFGRPGNAPPVKLASDIGATVRTAGIDPKWRQRCRQRLPLESTHVSRWVANRTIPKADVQRRVPPAGSPQKRSLTRSLDRKSVV